MRQFRYVILVALAGFAVAGLAFACTQKAADEAIDATRDGAATAVDEIRTAGEAVGDATADAAERTADKATEMAGDIAMQTDELASTTSEAITDAWITTQVSAKFVDEALFRGSDIDVDTDNHVVTLKGTVASTAAKNRAAVIAGETQGVNRVVNQLVVS
jgi:osmotically-inducible protein OsmY